MAAPPFACFPVCVLFLSLGIVGVIVYLAGYGAVGQAPGRTPAGGTAARPPYWVAAVTLVVVTVVLLLLSLVTDG